MARRLKVIQAASDREYGPGAEIRGYATLLERRLAPLHKTFCNRYGYAYEADTSTQPFHPFWMKAYMMLKAIDEGYDQIVWLDADAIWLGDYPLNPKFETVFGATYHEMFWHPNHFNAGVLYVNVNEQTEQVIKDWFAQRENNFNDQEVLNANLSEHITAIGWEWNCHIWIPYYRVANPKVVAWHGCPDRIPKMLDFLDNLNRFSN